LALQQGHTDEQVARLLFERGAATLRVSRELVGELKTKGLLRCLTPRQKTGSAENPITKLFPATITEQRFLEVLDEIGEHRPSLRYHDDRESRSLSDFTLSEGDETVPINIKNAGTRFEQARALVGLDPDDTIPIPAYKAHAAITSMPNLLYIISVDYSLIGSLNSLLPQLFNVQEKIVWDLLNSYAGTLLRNAEDTFIFGMVRKYWEQLRPIAIQNPFNVISARKAVRILQTKPQRTPGIGLRAWGTGASAEVNVHISIQDETTPWPDIASRIVAKGLVDIVLAVNRKRMEQVYDTEI
jgi:hypothetical protein